MRRFKRLVLIGFMSLSILICCSKSNDIQLFGSGTVEATEVLLRAKLVGDVLEMFVEEGDQVDVGQIVAQIDTEKVVLQKRQVKAGLEELELSVQNARRAVGLAEDQLQNASNKYDRLKALYEQQSITEQQMDDVEMALKVATTKSENARTSLLALRAKREQLQAQLELLDSQVRDATVRAPVAATVINKFIEQGETVSAGSPIVNLADLERMWIRVYLTTADIGRIRLGSEASLRADAFARKSFPGKVVWISPKAEFTPKNVQTRDARADLVYAVKVVVENPTGELKIGMPADVYFD